jgi:hypothetical protein
LHNLFSEHSYIKMLGRPQPFVEVALCRGFDFRPISQRTQDVRVQLYD